MLFKDFWADREQDIKKIMQQKMELQDVETMDMRGLELETSVSEVKD